MAHSRDRFLTSQIHFRLKFSPVVAIQGARQTGKSYLARELLFGKKSKIVYRTLDNKADRDFARFNPESFLNQIDKEEVLFIIDEVQKVPVLFDSIKASVDENRKPGRFLILGSTEFSLLQRIRESLTGRMSRVRLFPFTLAESRKNVGSESIDLSKILSRKESRFSRKELLQYLNRGGMPGIFHIREENIRNQMISDWIDLTVQRDLLQIPKIKLDTDLAYSILKKIATIDDPIASEIAKSLSEDTRVVQTHLKALASLFAITSIKPFSNSTGKEHWFLLDVAFVEYFGGSFLRKLQTWALNEILVANSLSKQPYEITFYRNSKGSLINFIITDKNQITAIQIFGKESIYDRDLNLLRSFGKSNQSAQLIALAGGWQNHPKEKIYVRPWEWIC